MVSTRAWWMISCAAIACGDGFGRRDVTAGITSTSAGAGGDATIGDASTGHDATSDADTTHAGSSASTAASDGDSSSSGDGGSTPTASVVGLDFLCKLINGTSVEDPSANHTHTRFNLRATDLGIPLVIAERLHLFFGDTHGYREIWAIGEDPDSVAHVDAAAAASDPSVLCTQLEFIVTPDVPSVAADTDASILRDFAVGWMSPPPGEDLSAYIGHHPAPFPAIPGSFEVPSGALAIDDAVYLFWAGKSEFEPHDRMTLSYLVRWDEPRTQPTYQIVRPIDSLPSGALGGRFLQILPFVSDDTIYLFGTGEYRRSGIYLARMPKSALEQGGGEELWDPSAAAWVDPASAIDPVVEREGVGELGGVFVPGPDLWLLMYQHAATIGGTLVSNKIVVRTAPAPEGPWSEQLVVIDMADPLFQLQHCCLAEPCVGEQIWQCQQAGLYGAYPLPNPRVTPADDGSYAVDLPFVVSTWMPYDVVLFEAHLVLAPQ
ncbi:MAG TPA: DUF4185 domain-containing protein [Nannocystaceae bacterium]|nr:DUF4185 domain-containing protein [Nannocystaceae bacterium]